MTEVEKAEPIIADQPQFIEDVVADLARVVVDLTRVVDSLPKQPTSPSVSLETAEALKRLLKFAPDCD